MRRMLPQKLIDYIKEVKNGLTINEDGEFILGTHITASSFSVANSSMMLADDGLWLNDDNNISELGNGIESDAGTLQVKAKTNGGIEVSADGVALSKKLYRHEINIAFDAQSQNELDSLNVKLFSNKSSAYTMSEITQDLFYDSLWTQARAEANQDTGYVMYFEDDGTIYMYVDGVGLYEKYYIPNHITTVQDIVTEY